MYFYHVYIFSSQNSLQLVIDSFLSQVFVPNLLFFSSVKLTQVIRNRNSLLILQTFEVIEREQFVIP